MATRPVDLAQQDWRPAKRRRKTPRGLEVLPDGLEIHKRLAALDQANTEWQRDLVVSAWKMSELAPDVLSRGAAGALLKEAQEILTKLKATGALRADQQSWNDMIQQRLDSWK